MGIELSSVIRKSMKEGGADVDNHSSRLKKTLPIGPGETRPVVL